MISVMWTESWNLLYNVEFHNKIVNFIYNLCMYVKKSLRLKIILQIQVDIIFIIINMYINHSNTIQKH